MDAYLYMIDGCLPVYDRGIDGCHPSQSLQSFILHMVVSCESGWREMI